MNKVKIGIPELDASLGGGIFPGSTILLAGHPGSGKTTFAIQFLYEGIKSHENVLYVGSIERKEELYRHMNGLGFLLKNKEREGKFFTWILYRLLLSMI